MPIKEKREKRDNQPKKFTNEIKTAIYELHKEKKTDAFNIQRNKVVSLIRKNKKNFYNDAISKTSLLVVYGKKIYSRPRHEWPRAIYFFQTYVL